MMNFELELLTRRAAGFNPRGGFGGANARKPVLLDALIHFEFAVWDSASLPWPGRCAGLRLSGVPRGTPFGHPSIGCIRKANREELRADMIGLRSMEDRVSAGAYCSDRWSVAASGEGSR